MNRSKQPSFPPPAPTEKGYALAPLQAGMLFQALLEGSGTRSAGFDIEQLHMVLHEAIDASAFGTAWTLVAQRHAALSTAFSWEQAGGPRQHVVPAVQVPLEASDWSGLDAPGRAERRASFLQRDRARGFDLRHAPLLRVSVFAVNAQLTEVVWTFHHIVLDGRSFPIVLKEVFLAYDALRQGMEPAFSEPPTPYRAYIEWLSTRELAPSRAFFRALLADKIAATPLPCAEPQTRPLAREGYAQRSFLIEPQQTEHLRALAQRTHVTLGTLAHAAWALVLSRYTGDGDVLFGSTRSGRHTALDGAARGMVGLFINTLPMRAQIFDQRTLAELLVDMRQQSVSLRAHEHTPRDLIREQSGIAFGAALFETLVTFEHSTSLFARPSQSGLPPQSMLHEQPALPLNVIFSESDGLEVRVLFDCSRFRDQVIERLLESLVFVLTQWADGELEHTPLGDLAIMPPHEVERVVAHWNATQRPFPESLLIQGLFEDQVRARPEQVAVEMGCQALTYSQLDARANQLAHALIARGARPNRYIAVCLDRGIDLVVALLAVAKSGAAYLPLDPQHPIPRLRFMLADAEAVLVITEPGHRLHFEGEIPTLDPRDPTLASLPVARPLHGAQASDVCYAIFTSGSTGSPNGVVLSHRAVVNTLDWVNRTFGVSASDRILFVTSPCFDLSVYDIFGVLGAGGSVVVASEAQLSDPNALVAALDRERITIWDSAPAALQRLVPSFGAPVLPTSLRLVLLSGDWIPLSLPDDVRGRFPHAQVVGLGGATEAAIWSNWFSIDEIDPRWTSIPYGNPIQNARYHVLDERLRPVPVGVVGDLYIGGVCLAEGYLHRPDLTRARFIDDPFALVPGQRLYKTGDLARYFDDGKLEFLGRSDFQLKVRGYRVEIGEIEAALRAIDGVREAVCSAFADASAQQSLVAFLVLSDDSELDETATKHRLAGTLPDYMVPSHVVRLPALPLSSNGKVDRKALVVPSERVAREDYVPPRSQPERQLVRLWETLLPRRPIGVTDNFFAIGGHSLLALNVVGQAQALFGLDIPLPRFIEQPTIRGLLQAIELGTVRSQHGLRTFHPSGSRPALVLLGGAAFAPLYRAFPQPFGADQPVYLFEAQDDEVEGGNFAQQACALESALLPLCAHGPVALGGFGAHALLAVELARRLHGNGQQVILVVCVDGIPPEPPKPTLMQRFAALGRRWQGSGELQHSTQNFSGPAGPPTPCELLLIRAQLGSRVHACDSLSAWRTAFVGPISQMTVAGDHMSFVGTPDHARVADAISRSIERLTP